jgi:hypothetical protein
MFVINGQPLELLFRAVCFAYTKSRMLDSMRPARCRGGARRKAQTDRLLGSAFP